MHGESWRQERHADDADFQRAVVKGRDLFTRRKLVRLDDNAGSTLTQHAQESWQHLVCGGTDEPEMDGARVAKLGLTHPLRDVLCVAQQRARLGQQQRATRGQLHMAAVSSKQLGADLRFQSLNLLAERRLGDPKARRGTSKVQLLRHCDEVFEVSQLKWL